MYRHLNSALTATLTVGFLVFGSSAVAGAQTESSADPAIQGSVAGSSQFPALTGSSLNTALSSLSLIGSSQLPLSGSLVTDDPDYPKTTDPSITEAEVVEKQVEDGRLERWTVASPAMQRNVSVQIQKSADSTAPAPMLYLLDGVTAPHNSGWVGQDVTDDVFADENVTLVMPTEADGSMYSDWVAEDPNMGRHMWETFLVDELAPLLEAEQELNFNGHRGIGGLSMGAIGALQIANAHPGVFDAAFGISGCYSTLDDIGRQMSHLIVESRGGDVENMWGEFGSEEWVSHDVTNDPSGLRDTAVYLSAGNGKVSEQTHEFYDSPIPMTSGVILERGVLHCTQELDQAMQEEGMDHHRVDYLEDGTHNWLNFREQAAPAWEHIKPALY